MSQIVKKAAIMALLSNNAEGLRLNDSHYRGMGNEITLQYNDQQMKEFRTEGPSMIKQNFANAEALTQENVFRASYNQEKANSTNPVDQEEISQQRADKAAEEMMAEQEFGGKKHGVKFFDMKEIDDMSA